MTIHVIECPTCGAATSREKENCDYCGNFLIHLSYFEQKKSGGKKQKIIKDDNKSSIYFRSLGLLYKISIIIGFVLCASIYIIFFDFLSESLLVMISPTWFLLIHFGISGYYTEKAVKLIIEKQSLNFRNSLKEVIGALPPLKALIVKLVFVPVYLLVNLNNISSPLKISFITTAAWAAFLYLFFMLIFPVL